MAISAAPLSSVPVASPPTLEDTFNDLSLATEHQSIGVFNETTDEKHIDSCKDLVVGGNECQPLWNESTSHLMNQRNASRTESNSVVTEGKVAAPINSTEVKDYLSFIPEELIIKIIKLLNPNHSTCLSLAGKKYYRIHKEVYPKRISLHEKDPQGIRLYHYLNSWMEARGFIFVAVGVNLGGPGQWGSPEMWFYIDYLRTNDLEDESYVKKHVAKYEKYDKCLKPRICQVGLVLKIEDPYPGDYEYTFRLLLDGW